MPFADPTTPSLADFLVFLTEEVQLPSDALAPSSPWPGYAYNQALAMIPMGAICIPGILYTLAVYNLATHILFKIAPNNGGSTYFSDARAKFGLNGIGGAASALGIATSASDQGTAGAISLPDWWGTLTLSSLDLLRTVWGQYAFAYMQDYGQGLWGLT